MDESVSQLARIIVVESGSEADRAALRFVLDALRGQFDVQSATVSHVSATVARKGDVVVSAWNDPAARAIRRDVDARHVAIVSEPELLSAQQRRHDGADLTLCFVPRWYLPVLAPLPAPAVVCGFLPVSDEGKEISPDLQAFLEAGSAPIVFALSNMNPNVAAIAARACASLGRRGLWVGSAPEDATSESFFATAKVPLSAIMRWARAVVHDGSTSVAAAAFKNRVPQLVIGADDWSKRLAYRLFVMKAAKRLSAWRLREKSLAKALRLLLANENLTFRAAQCAQAIDARDIAEEVGRAVRRLITGGPPIVTMTMLGKFGRLGNQILQYAAIRIIARNNGYEAQIPPWPGELFFGHHHDRPRHPVRAAGDRPDDMPTVHEFLPEILRYVEAHSELPHILIRPQDLQKCSGDIDLCGNFMFHTKYLAPHREFFQSLFEPAPALRPALEQAERALRLRGKTVVGIHVRRGDFLNLPFSPFAFVVPPKWWRQWLESFWKTLDDPILFIASDDPTEMKAALADFHPVTASDLNIQFPRGMRQGSILLDHYLLSRCDAVGISNSSYGFTACMLNQRANRFARASPQPPYLMEFNPWNASPLLISGDPPGEVSYAEAWKRSRQTLTPWETFKSFCFHWPKDRLLVTGNRWIMSFHSDGLAGCAMSVVLETLGRERWRNVRGRLTPEGLRSS